MKKLLPDNVRQQAGSDPVAQKPRRMPIWSLHIWKDSLCGLLSAVLVSLFKEAPPPFLASASSTNDTAKGFSHHFPQLWHGV